MAVFEVIEGLESAIDGAAKGKEAAGRSESGRRWSIVVTDLEKVAALVHYYFPSGHVRTMASKDA